MTLNDSAALKHASFCYKALASISRSNTRNGYDRAGFSFKKQDTGISLTFSGHEVAVMGPGFTRDDVRAVLRATIEQHLLQAIQALRKHLKAHLCIPEWSHLGFDVDYDWPRMLSTELPSLNFKIHRCMKAPHCGFSFSLEEQLVRVWSRAPVQTFTGTTYAEMLEPAIEYFKTHVQHQCEEG